MLRRTTHPICCFSFKVEDVHSLHETQKDIDEPSSVSQQMDLQGVFWCSAFHVLVFPLNGDNWEINKFYHKIYISSINILPCSGELCLFCLKNWKKGLSDSYAISHIPGYHPETTVPTSAQPLLPVANPNPMHGGAEPSGCFRSGFTWQSLQKSAALSSLPQECHLRMSLPPPLLTKYLAAEENEK